MSNIQAVQASFIQRKVQKEYEQNGRDWLEIIEEEVEKMDTLLSLAITGGDESWI